MYKWPDKDPDEQLDYSIDWSRFLDDDTITSVIWYVEDSDGTKTQISTAPSSTVNGLTYVSQTNSTTVTSVVLKAGTNNVRYKVTCNATTANAMVYERSVYLRVKEK